MKSTLETRKDAAKEAFLRGDVSGLPRSDGFLVQNSERIGTILIEAPEYLGTYWVRVSLIVPVKPVNMYSGTVQIRLLNRTQVRVLTGNSVSEDVSFPDPVCPDFRISVYFREGSLTIQYTDTSSGDKIGEIIRIGVEHIVQTTIRPLE